MRVFDHFSPVGEPCPVCKTRDDKPACLVGVDGTQDDGIMEAQQFHVDCLELMVKPLGADKIIYQLLKA